MYINRYYQAVIHPVPGNYVVFNVSQQEAKLSLG